MVILPDDIINIILFEYLDDIELKEIRGNVGTRINKLKNGEFDAIILAYAGLKRLKIKGFYEKIEIKEVPVEIVRRELVHVPIYSTESGVVDVSEHLRDSAPKSEKLKQSNLDASTTEKKND